jgi:hypothetical protein
LNNTAIIRHYDPMLFFAIKVILGNFSPVMKTHFIQVCAKHTQFSIAGGKYNWALLCEKHPDQGAEGSIDDFILFLRLD